MVLICYTLNLEEFNIESISKFEFTLIIEFGSTYMSTHHFPCAAIDCWATEDFPV